MPKADIAAVLSLFHKNKEIIVIFGFYCVLLWRFLIKRLSMTIKEYFEGDRFAMDAGIIIDEIKEGYALLHMTVDERHLNGAGWCQGGAIFTLADLAFACATNSRCGSRHQAHCRSPRDLRPQDLAFRRSQGYRRYRTTDGSNDIERLPPPSCPSLGIRRQTMSL